MTCLPSFINIGPDIQKLKGADIQTYRELGDHISILLLILEIRQVGYICIRKVLVTDLSAWTQVFLSGAFVIILSVSTYIPWLDPLLSRYIFLPIFFS
jgi:hypothetical protein